MKNTEKKDEDLVKIVQPLVDWYRENKRDLPWRHNPDAYRARQFTLTIRIGL